MSKEKRNDNVLKISVELDLTEAEEKLNAFIKKIKETKSLAGEMVSLMGEKD